MALFDPRMFDPKAYQGIGGLLGGMFATPYKLPQSAGFPQMQQEQVAQQMPAQQIPAPQVPATTELSAQSRQAEPSWNDRLAAFANNPSRVEGVIPKMIEAFSGLATGQRTDAQGIANQTAQYLTTKGIAPEMAASIVRSPQLLQTVLQHVMGIGGQTGDIKEYEYAKNQGFKGSLADWMAQKRAGAGEYSLTPVYGTDAQGNTVLIQPGKSGTAIQTHLPEGVKISSGVEKMDLGTQWGIVDKRTGNIVGYQPKDVRGAASEKAIGTEQGGVRANLDANIIGADQTIKQVDELLSNKGLDSIVGPLDQFRPSWALGGEGRDALARYNQLKGKAFLDAYTTLRGGGAITEVEGVKAENAMARMDRAQSEEDFRRALKDFREAVSTGIQKLKARAGYTGQMPAQMQSPMQPPANNGWKIERVQ